MVLVGRAARLGRPTERERGWLADAHDYRFAFRITACTHALAAALLLPLVVLEWRAARA